VARAARVCRAPAAQRSLPRRREDGRGARGPRRVATRFAALLRGRDGLCRAGKRRGELRSGQGRQGENGNPAPPAMPPLIGTSVDSGFPPDAVELTGTVQAARAKAFPWGQVPPACPTATGFGRPPLDSTGPRTHVAPVVCASASLLSSASRRRARGQISRSPHRVASPRVRSELRTGLRRGVAPRRELAGPKRPRAPPRVLGDRRTALRLDAGPSEGRGSDPLEGRTCLHIAETRSRVGPPTRSRIGECTAYDMPVNAGAMPSAGRKADDAGDQPENASCSAGAPSRAGGVRCAWRLTRTRCVFEVAQVLSTFSNSALLTGRGSP
jgi:hypothetical protein